MPPPAPSQALVPNQRMRDLLKAIQDKWKRKQLRPVEQQALMECAAAAGDEGLVRTLLKEGAGVNQPPTINYSALHLAAINGHTRIIRLLVAAGASVTEPSADGRRPLHMAATGGHAAAARLLVEAAPQVALQPVCHGMAGSTPFLLAANNGHVGVARLLLQAVPAAASVTVSSTQSGAQVTSLPVHMAALTDDTALLRLLLESDPGMATAPGHVGLTPIHIAANRGCCASLRLLLAAAPAAAAKAPDGNGCQPVHHAAQEAQLETLALLLQAAPSLATAATPAGYTPLHFFAAAAPNCSPQVAHSLVQLVLAADPAAATARAQSGCLPLGAALCAGNATAARLLVAAAPGTACEPHPADGLLPLQQVLERGLKAGGPRSSARAKFVEAARPLLAVMPPAQALPVLTSPPLARTALPLFADLAAAWPLSDQQWEAVPKRCPGLGRALPAVLARSEREAALLVARLTPADRQRLRTAALSLARQQRRLRTSLPPVLLAWILPHMFDAPAP